MKHGLLCLLLLVTSSLRAAEFDCRLQRPAQQDQLVFQYAELLTQAERQHLNGKLARFARETSNQILVLIVDTLCGLPESDLAFEVGEKWGIGQKGFDNGIVILIKPTGPPGDRRVFIATGYGLEGAIPDLTAKRVVDNEILPRFQQQRYFEGLDRATEVLMAMAIGEYNEQRHGAQEQVPPAGAIVMFLIIMAIVFLSWRGQVNRYARRNNVDFWTAMFLLSQMNKRHRRGGGFGGFGGGGGGFGGGGFGGFGGGSFGGGGAGGRW
jgi:uncharacterized protein